MSNFDIMNWVKELKIKDFDDIFNKDSRKWASNCGIINLDSNNGPGTHWVCYFVLLFFCCCFFFIPLDYHHSKIFFLSNDTILHNIKDRYLFFVVSFVFFFIKKIQDGNSIYNGLYKILDPMKQF